MEIGDLEQLLSLHPEVDILAKELSKKREKHFLLKNLHASAQAIILSALANKLAQKQARNLLIVLDNAEQAQYLFSDLRTLRKDQGVYLFPTSHRRRQGKDEAMAVQRTEVLSALIMDKRSSEELMGNGYRVSNNGNEVIIITYPEALSESVPAPQALQKQTIQIAVEEEIAQSSIVKQLVELNFKRVDFVYEPGQFAVRGHVGRPGGEILDARHGGSSSHQLRALLLQCKEVQKHLQILTALDVVKVKLLDARFVVHDSYIDVLSDLQGIESVDSTADNYTVLAVICIVYS